jgi:hypothetical protein
VTLGLIADEENSATTVSLKNRAIGMKIEKYHAVDFALVEKLALDHNHSFGK